jgi:hypothetical protein
MLMTWVGYAGEGHGAASYRGRRSVSGITKILTVRGLSYRKTSVLSMKPSSDAACNGKVVAEDAEEMAWLGVDK